MSNYRVGVRSKLPNIGTTIFTVMSALANEHGAINLSQGFPDFDCPSDLTDLVSFYLKKGYNQYAPMAGLPGLREQIAQKTDKLYHFYPNPETDITITAGGTQAIYTAITALVNEGDEVMVFEPCYDCYVPAIRLCGAIPVHIPLQENNYRIPWDLVKKMISSRTRMILLNSPHNPTGSVLDASDLQELQRLVTGTDIVLLSDEVYEHVIFDGLRHESMLLYPELRERSVVVFSFGKTFHNTGWKIGYAIAPDYLTREFRKSHQFIVFSVNTPFQYALADYLQTPEHYLSLSEFYRQKRDYFLQLLSGSRFSYVPASGSYFQLLHYDAISDEKDTDFAVRLTKENGVAAIPVSVFYSKPEQATQRVLRFCFAKKNETLEQAAEKLLKV
ncbi:MAG: aminotransferase class I/II-fold pyridoxal phosphate-dependent enzyme [Sphingobacteriales bacterium]|nr:MAG: aminotransferase class I/II-fold pyridoxal phosphate-dependent enzyme [Sphingobacteriales bacterium]